MHDPAISKPWAESDAAAGVEGAHVLPAVGATEAERHGANGPAQFVFVPVRHVLEIRASFQ
jgi:hypothetical protein